jgi:hypothetical protein
MNDTPLHIKKKLSQMMAERTPTERLRMVSSMFATGKKLIEAGLRREDATINATQLKVGTFKRLYGGDFTNSEIKKIVKHLSNQDYPD